MVRFAECFSLMSLDMKHFDNCLKCAFNSNLPSVKVLGDKYGNAVSLKLI